MAGVPLLAAPAIAQALWQSSGSSRNTQNMTAYEGSKRTGYSLQHSRSRWASPGGSIRGKKFWQAAEGPAPAEAAGRSGSAASAGGGPSRGLGTNSSSVQQGAEPGPGTARDRGRRAPRFPGGRLFQRGPGAPSSPDTPIHRQKQWFKETFTYLFAISNSAEASEAGIHLVSGWQVFKSTPKEELPFWSDIVLGFRAMSEAELLKFPQHQFGQAFTTLKCDCPPYLLWLEKRLKATGTQMYTRKVADLWELHSEYDIVVNCAGIGAHQLVGDKQLFPVRGQVLKVHAPWVKHFIRDGDGLTYIYPGIHRVTLGGTREEGSWSLSPDDGTTRDIFDRCCSLEPSLHGAQDIQVKVGLRPSRQCVRVQREVLSQGGVKLPVVHNYGHGAGGFSVHRGTANEAAHLVEECISALQGSSLRAKL
ncbi:D-aspartate oxidase isoform X1 [Parus major]|uniref:D-aspartate oxidase isoform X1 n=1 Tax=Parus major TaxID=9157 RepID=UPI00108CDEE8|nr:D-aspartate oxidase isoform X1 [Parus major]